MNKSQIQSDTYPDVSLRYELSSLIGTTLVPNEAVKNFLQALKQNLSLLNADLWLSNRLIQKKNKQRKKFEAFSYLNEDFYNPPLKTITSAHSLIKDLQNRPFSFYENDQLKTFRKIGIDNKNIPFKIITLGLEDIGFINLYIEADSNAIDASLLEFILPVFDQFRLNLECCFRSQESHYQATKNQNYQQMVESAIDLIFRLNREGYFTFINQGLYELTGFAPEELIGEHFSKIVRGDYHNEVERFYKDRSQDKSADTALEFPILTKSNGIRWIEQKVQVRQEKGKALELTVMARDNTERHNAEEQVRLLYKWVDHFRDAVLVTDIDGTIIFLNQETATRIGSEIDSLIGKKIQEEDQANLWSVHLEQVKNQEKIIVEGLGHPKDQASFPVEMRLQYMNFEGQEFVITFSRDITKRKKTQELLMNKQHQLESFVEAVPAAIAMLDKELRFIAVSHRWFEDLRIEEQDIVGKDFYDTLTKYPIQWKETLEKCMQGSTERCEAEKITFDDGTETWIQWEVRPWYNRNQEIEGLVMFTEDITERKLQEQALQIATIKAEEGSQAKQQFLANMSHEIRTPMNAILGMTRLLQRTNPSNQQKTYLDAIKASADNLLVIINDILDISKIEAGKLNIESVGFNLSHLVKRLCDSIEFRANEKGIGLFDYVDRRISDVLIGDPVRLNQVLLNLVNNAIKFTEKGSVEIECNLIESNEQENVILFQVIDTGIGIDKAKLATIFESFSQGDDSISREYGGTGLGLSISNQLVELFGGQLQVKTKRAIGTTFFFTLRMKVGSEEQVPKPLEAKRKDVSIRGLKVLLAEDHDINQYLATTLLDEWGTVVEVVENGKEVIKKVTDHDYDVILMDIQMPIMDGIDATKIIRRQLRRDVPIIALTANALKGDSHKYLNAGMNAYVSKPFEPVELFNTIATVVNLDEGSKSNLKNEKEESDILKVLPEQQNNSQQQEEMLYNLSKINKMVEGDKVMVKKMIQMFLEKTPESINGINAHYEKGEFDEVGKLAHRLKTSIDLMGIEVLHNNIRSIERFAFEENQREKLPDLIEELKEVCDKVASQLRNEL